MTTRTTTPRTSSDSATYSDEFRADFDREYAGRGVRYEDYEPAYRWGFENADTYRGRDWATAESGHPPRLGAQQPGRRLGALQERGAPRLGPRARPSVERAVGADDRTTTRGTRM